MAQRDEDSPDREAILARRRHFIARALPGRVMVVAVSGLATACPCLSIGAPEPPGTSTGDETATSTGSETSTSTGTETSTSTGDEPETGETEAGETEAGETEGPS